MAAVAIVVWQARVSILGLLLWIAIPLVVIAILSERSRETIGKVLSAGCRAVGGIVKVGSSAASSAVNAGERRHTYSVEVRSFRIVDAAGATHQCILRGELAGGGDLRVGDDVIVHGLGRRHGALRVRRIEVVSAGTVVTGRIPIGAHIVRLRQGLLVALGITAATLVVVHFR